MTGHQNRLPKNIQDIIRDREIIELEIIEFVGLSYRQWEVQPPIYGDQVESLLENGFMLWIDDERRIIVQKPINPSPEQVMQNKFFWRRLGESLND